MSDQAEATGSISEQVQSQPTIETQLEAKAAPSMNEVAKETLAKFKVQIDGAEAEVDQDELIRGYQLAKASHKKFQEASDERKKAEQLYSKVKTNPRDALRELELDPDKLAEDWLTEKISKELMSPEQRRLSELESELASIKGEKARIEKQKADELHTAEVERLTQEYVKTINNALEAGGLPQDRSIASRVAAHMQEAHNLGYDLPAAEAVKLVKQELKEYYKPVLGNSKIDQIAEMIGESNMKALVDYYTAKFKIPGGAAVAPAQQPDSKVQPVKTKKNLDQFFRELDRKLG